MDSLSFPKSRANMLTFCATAAIFGFIDAVIAACLVILASIHTFNKFQSASQNYRLKSLFTALLTNCFIKFDAAFYASVVSPFKWRGCRGCRNRKKHNGDTKDKINY